LARAGLADEGERLAGAHLERDVVDRAEALGAAEDPTGGRGELLHQVLRSQEDFPSVAHRSSQAAGAVVRSSPISSSMRGTASRSMRVYGSCGSVKIRSTGPCSTSAPSRMTTMWSVTSLTTAR